MFMKDEVYKIIKDNASSHWWAISKDRILQEFVKSLNIPIGGNILELGIGTGDFLSKLEFIHKFGIDSYRYPEASALW